MTEKKKWTETENKYLVTAIKNGCSAAEIAKQLGRSEKSVQEHSRRLKIVVSQIKEKQNAASFSEVDVKCPFFEKFYRGKSIRCEGLTPSGYISVGFGDEFFWKRHVKDFCNKEYRQCPFYQIVSKIYEK